jgi:folate-dependent phosphoribosylglycinamide formyltransferase PurN
MSQQLLFDPSKTNRPMRVAGFMSGSGTNIQKLLELERTLRRETGSSPFEVVFIFSDRSDGKSRGEALALEAGIPYFSYDIRRFHELRNARRTVRSEEGLQLRREYDTVARTLIQAFEVDVSALGGYMSYITLDRCINVHPADLSIHDKNGRRMFVGDDAVLDAIKAGQIELRASTLWADAGVDTGPLLMVSEPLPVKLPGPVQVLAQDPERLRRIADEHQEQLKRVGDWRIFPQTILMIAQGRFAIDEHGAVYVGGKPVPHGYRQNVPQAIPDTCPNSGVLFPRLPERFQ